MFNSLFSCVKFDFDFGVILYSLRLTACAVCLPVECVCLCSVSACAVCLPVQCVCLCSVSACAVSLPVQCVCLCSVCTLFFFFVHFFFVLLYDGLSKIVLYPPEILWIVASYFYETRKMVPMRLGTCLKKSTLKAASVKYSSLNKDLKCLFDSNIVIFVVRKMLIPSIFDGLFSSINN